MSIAKLTKVEAPQLDDLDQSAFDIDVDVKVEQIPASTMITSVVVCTPGCTSPGGGSFCSYCC